MREYDEYAAEDEVCGETYEHDLDEIGRRDGVLTEICKRCGAEVVTELHPMFDHVRASQPRVDLLLGFLEFLRERGAHPGPEGETARLVDEYLHIDRAELGRELVEMGDEARNEEDEN